MRGIMEQLTDENESVEELFKVISAEVPTVQHELPLDTVLREARQKGFLISCYTEGSDSVTASTDPTFIGESVQTLKTGDGRVVRDVATEELRKSGGDEAIFTYVVHPSDKAPVIDGKKIAHGRVVVARDRKAFKKLQSGKKFICTISAEAHLEN